jgi:signal transduction histidine kinase
MIFRRISYTLALQFTAFVFVLFLVNGTIFLLADFGNARRDMHFRMARTSQTIVQNALRSPRDIGATIPPMMRDRVRIFDALGRPMYAGALLADEPFTSEQGFQNKRINNEDYTVMTAQILADGRHGGYVQIAEIERLPLAGLPLRALLYLLISVAVSALTFMVGLFFSRRSLRPAEQMMERLEQFTQDASHELRTPLAAMSSSLDLALRNGKHEQGIRSAKDDLKQVETLVERLLELARLDSFAVATDRVDLSGLLEESADRLRPMAVEKNVSIVTDIRPGVSVNGDAALLRQVIGNLLMNAIKFNKQDGQINLRLTKDTLSVDDTGVGIDPASVDHIFNRFYRADASRTADGFGLGLALVKRIVDLHGWTIGVKSVLGTGTTFTIALSQKQPKQSKKTE